MDNEDFLQVNQEQLTAIVRPFQQELNRCQRLADFIKQCIRCAGRDDFLRLDELLNTKPATEVVQEEALAECAPILESLRADAREKVEKYRLEFIEDLTRLGNDAGLAIDIDFPRFSILKGIDGEIAFSERTTTINKKVLKSIDPRRIVAALVRLKKQLYDRPFNPQEYIDGLYETYVGICKADNLAVGQPVPIQRFYLQHVISLQSKTFFTNMDKAKFRGYSLEQFSVDLWRYFESGIGGTSDGKLLDLDPGRNFSLWLLDGVGERRQISSISFKED
ncbi:MAG: hypothetical protein J7J70_11525 [Deltaproteobacteria bacterium]|nr:hypothetical protein [Candidatus Tharpellaceae bacterium]HDJ27775.1 hypothetical protein [Pseudomonadota bacterium]